MRAYAPGRASRRTLLIGDWRYSLTGRGLFTFPPRKDYRYNPKSKASFRFHPEANVSWICFIALV